MDIVCIFICLAYDYFLKDFNHYIYIDEYAVNNTYRLFVKNQSNNVRQHESDLFLPILIG